MSFTFNQDNGLFRSGKARLIMGDPLKAREQTNDDDTPRLNKDGTQSTEYYIGLAFPKNDPDWVGLKAAMEAKARAEWQGKINLDHAQFSWKFRDGDTHRDKQGVLLSEKYPAAAGHYVLGLSRNGSFGLPAFWARTIFLPDGHPDKAALAPGEAGPAVPLSADIAANLFKRGYFVRVFGEYKSNGNLKYPGQYSNFEALELIDYGEEIVSTGGRKSYEEMFGGDAALPPPAGGAPAPAAPSPVAPPTASPTSAPLPPPHAGFMAPPPPAAPVVPTLNAKGQAAAPGATYEAFISSGWTHDQLKANGYID